MRRLIKSLKAILLVLLFAVSAFSQAKPAMIQWHKDFSLALKAAQSAGKPVLINFNAAWCLQCKTMEKDLWAKPEIIVLSEDFVSVTIDFDRDRGTIARFGVTSVPHVVLADPWGNMLAFHHGFGKETSENLVRAAMKTVHKDFSAIKAPNLRLEIDKNDASALIQIGDFYRQNNALFVSNNYFKAALRTKQLKTDFALREKALIAAGDNYLKLRDYDEAERFFNQSLREFPNGEHNETAFFGLITINIRRQRLSEAETVFGQMKSKFPDSQITQQASENLQEAKTQSN